MKKVTVARDRRRPGSPWVVTTYESRKPKRKFFKTREDAERYASDLRAIIAKGGDLSRIAVAVQQIAGTGYDIVEVVHAGLASLQKQAVWGTASTMTFRQAAALVIARAEKLGRRKITLDGYKAAFATHNKVFGDRIAACITEAEVEAYLDRIPARWSKGERCTPASKKTYLRTIRSVIRAAGVEKPLPGILISAPDVEPAFFTVEEVQRLFSATLPHDRAMLALAIFAGLRPFRLHELPKQCVSVADRRIHMPRWLSKNRHAVDLFTGAEGDDHHWPGLPPVLWTWLEKYPFQPRPWRRIQRRLARALGRKWIHDGCRHTAATYYKALHGLAATSELLAHISGGLVLKHYVGFAQKCEANRFYAITPDSVSEPATPSRKRVVIPYSPEELTRLLKTKPLSRLAAEIGCSDCAVIGHCRRLGIPTPKRGEWTARAFRAIYGDRPKRGNVDTEPTLSPDSQKAQSESNSGELIIDQVPKVRLNNPEAGQIIDQKCPSAGDL